MLHYFVYSTNAKGAYGIPTEVGYLNKLVSAFKLLRGDNYNNGNYKNNLLFDGANGVGSLKMLQFNKILEKTLIATVFNSNGKINFDVSYNSLT